MSPKNTSKTELDLNLAETLVETSPQTKKELKMSNGENLSIAELEALLEKKRKDEKRVGLLNKIKEKNLDALDVSVLEKVLAVLEGGASKPSKGASTGKRGPRGTVQHISSEAILKAFDGKTEPITKKEIVSILAVEEKQIAKGFAELTKTKKVSMVGDKRSAKWLRA